MPIPSARVRPRGEAVGTYRCRGVVGSGLACLGLAVLLVAYATYVWSTGQKGVPFDLAIVAVASAALLLPSGVGFLRSRIEITPTFIVSYWVFSTAEYPLASLVGATITPPRIHADSTNGAKDWRLTYGGTPAYGIFGYALGNVLIALIGWLLIPGSRVDQVLHLIPRAGGPIKVRSISSRRSSHLGDAGIALQAVLQAIGPLRTPDDAAERHADPIQWQAEMPSFGDWTWPGQIGGASGGTPAPGRRDGRATS